MPQRSSISPDLVAKMTDAEANRYKELLELELAQSSPLNLAGIIFPETRRWKNLLYLDEFLVALSEYRLTQAGPVPAGDVSWWFTPSMGADRVYIAGPHEIPGEVDEYGADTPKGPVVFRLAISMHPRAGKSRMVTEVFPLWLLLLDPDHQIAVGTYSDTWAAEWGGKMRDQMLEQANVYPWLPSPRGGIRAPKERFEVEGRRGRIRYVGVGGGITGDGFGTMIGDDFIKNAEQAESPTARENAGGFYDTTWSTRKTRNFAPGARYPIPFEVLMNTRWHEGDVQGHACYDEETREPRTDWCILNLPALAEADDPLGREVGEALVPEVKNRVELEELRRTNARVFASLYQGRPSPEGGGLLPAEYGHWWRVDGMFAFRDEDGEIITVPEDDCTFFASADMAATKKTSADYTVMCSWAFSRRYDMLFMLHMYRKRITTDEYPEELIPLIHQYDSSKVYVENVSYGQVFAQALRRERVRSEEVATVGDKVARAIRSNVALRIRDRRLLIPVGADWEGDLVHEMSHFPYGDHDDIVDAVVIGAQAAEDVPRFVPKKVKRAPTLAEELDAHVEAQTRPQRKRRTVWDAVGRRL